MLSVVVALLRTPVSALVRRVPGIWWVAIFASLFAGAGLFGAGYAYAHSGMEQRVAEARQTARDQIAAAAVAKRDARAEYSRAQAERRRADSASVTASASRTELEQLVERAGRSRAAVDTVGLPLQLRTALRDADALRIHVTPTLAADSIAIARKDGTIAHLEATIVLQLGAIAADSLAIHALETQLANQVAPRCSAKCGALLGGIGLEIVHQLPAIVRALTRGP